MNKPEISIYESMNTHDLIHEYKLGYEKIPKDILYLDEEKINLRFKKEDHAGLWSCKEIIGHIADAEVAVTHRLRRIYSEDKPKLAIWDEEQFFRSGIYELNSIQEYLESIKSIRGLTASTLEKFTEKDFSRVAIHPERGEISVKEIFSYITWHLVYHSWYLTRKIELLK
ncbi:MAG: DinB family protein [Leptospiraceae bacterium]|nr:DinB family protein [Leptospiraceae bacterium]